MRLYRPTYSLTTLLIVFAVHAMHPSFAQGRVGEHRSGDTVGGPDTRPEINNDGRGPKGGARLPKNGNGCHEGGCNKTTPTSSTSNNSTQKNDAEQQRQLKEKELREAAWAWQLKEDDQPLDDSSATIDWAIGRFKDMALGTYEFVIDALEPTPTGTSDYDKPKTKEEMKNLRAKLELEERELKRQKEENQKAYEENMKRLIPEEPKPEPTLNRSPASVAAQERFENAAKALAKVKSEDLGVIVDHAIRRSKPDAPIRLIPESAKQVEQLLSKLAPANACRISSTRSCYMPGAVQGENCFCPEFINRFDGRPVVGKTVREEVGRYCVQEESYADMYQMFPIGIRCLIPVNVSLNPHVPYFEYISGRVARKKCDTNDEWTFDPACR